MAEKKKTADPSLSFHNKTQTHGSRCDFDALYFDDHRAVFPLISAEVSSFTINDTEILNVATRANKLNLVYRMQKRKKRKLN